MSTNVDELREALECCDKADELLASGDKAGAHRFVANCGNVLRAAIAASKPEQCRLCDNSGDIHRADGEWFGECPHCKPEPQKPAECVGGCPEQQVCDYCQGTLGKDNMSLEKDVSNSVDYAQSAPSLNFGYSTPEPQAQAGEPDEYDIQVLQELAATLEFRSPERHKALTMAIITLQAHREAIALEQEFHSAAIQEYRDYCTELGQANAKKNAALKACVEAMTADTYPADKYDAIINQAREAL